MPKILIQSMLVFLTLAVLGIILVRHLIPMMDQPTYLEEIRDSVPPPPAGTYLAEIGVAEDEELAQEEPAEEEKPLSEQFRVDQGEGLRSKPDF